MQQYEQCKIQKSISYFNKNSKDIVICKKLLGTKCCWIENDADSKIS